MIMVTTMRRMAFAGVLFLILTGHASAQKIIKIVSGYVLVDVGPSSGLSIEDQVPVYRKTEAGTISKKGEIRIVRFDQGKCAGKIMKESSGDPISVGDFIQVQGTAGNGESRRMKSNQERMESSEDDAVSWNDLARVTDSWDDGVSGSLTEDSDRSPEKKPKPNQSYDSNGPSGLEPQEELGGESKTSAAEKWEIAPDKGDHASRQTPASTGRTSSTDVGREGIGVEASDNEIGFMASYFSYIGGEGGGGGGFGSVQLSYGKFISSKLVVGVAPMIYIFSGGGDTETQVTVSAFFKLNFSTSSRTIPYISGQWYQTDFSPEDGRDFLDASYLNVGAGIRNFFNSVTALNTSVTYGFALSEMSSGGVLQVLCGLSFIF
jgi:hypothetical protein